ncbi:DUF1931 family protein [Pseudonocardia sp.]|uniref:DUF1931 family protein n=1 Tax=Pseudonocardia sp. TaxID=60912 RepID=UPI00260B338E|nr:DUF1931 family protein [Pseudonocardia sp.]
MNVATFQRFFREAASLHVDKSDLKRFTEFVDKQAYDVAIVARDTARWNGRDVVEPPDLPLTKGLQECMREFTRLDDELTLLPALEQLTPRPPDVAFSEEAESRMLTFVGGLSVALARTFRVIDPRLANPRTEHWEQAFKIFDLLV